MNLNELSYQVSDENGFSVELLVDGKPISNLIGTDNKEIPYWIFKSDLPSWGIDEDSDIRIIGVCGCGEFGCDNARCRVICENDFVIFREIFIDGYTVPRNIEFKFSRENYDSVINEIIGKVREYEQIKKEN